MRLCENVFKCKVTRQSSGGEEMCWKPVLAFPPASVVTLTEYVSPVVVREHTLFHVTSTQLCKQCCVSYGN